MCNCVYLKIVLLLISLHAKSEVNQFGIPALPISVDPIQQRMAFIVGPRDGQSSPKTDSCQVYVLDLSNHRTEKILENESVFWFCWRNNGKNPELWISVQYEVLGFWPRYKLVVISFRDNTIDVESKKIVKNADIVGFLKWNQDGSILTGQPKKDYSVFGGGVFKGRIAISLSDGKNSRVYSKNNVNPSALYWITENTFFVQDLDRTSIIEFCVTQNDLLLNDIPYTADKIVLCGVIKNLPVYRRDGDIYWGDDLFYDSNGKVGWIRVSDSYMAFIDNSAIVVVDTTGKEIARKRVEKSGLIDISPLAKTVYFLSGIEKIQSWNFEKNSPIETLFDVKTIAE